MSFRRALVIACLIVVPGTLMRVAPHVDRLGGGAVVVTSAALSSMPSRLEHRSVSALALGMAAELAMHIGLLVVLLRYTAVVSLLRALPTSLRIAAAALFIAAMSGFLGGTSSTFPFVAWRMYSGEHAGFATVLGLSGTTRGGATRDLDIDRMLPILGDHRLYQILERLAAADGDTGTSADVLSTTLRQLGRLENRKQAADPLQQLSLHSGRIPLDSDRPPWIREQRVVRTVVIE